MSVQVGQAPNESRVGSGTEAASSRYRSRFLGSRPSRESDADNLDEVMEPDEVVGVACVQREAVRMSRGCDKQIRETTSMGAANFDDCRDDLTVATTCRRVEGQRFECRFDLLQTNLATGTFGTIGGQMRASGQFGEADR